MSVKEFDFERLLQPMDAATFFSEYWEQRPVAISRADPDYYAELFSLKDVDAVISLSTPKWPDFALVNHKRPSLVQNYVKPSDETVDINQVYEAYYRGDTIRYANLQQIWKPIAILCRNLEKFFNYTVNTNLYLTPKDAQGFSTHFDTEDVFILQVEGSKLWRVYDSVVPLPLVEQYQPVSPEKAPGNLREIYLQAGDMLYIPRGFVHEALTSDCSSLHLTVGVTIYRWTDLISSVLVSAGKQDVRFRKGLPPGFLTREELKSSLREQLTELLKILLDQANIDDAVEQLGRRFLANMLPLPDGHFTQIDQVNDIELDTIVAKRKGMICLIIQAEDSVSIKFPGNTVKGPRYIEPALRFIVDAGEFSVRSIPDSLTGNAKMVLVRHLIRAGLLAIVDHR
ncbi:MAG: cupin domain-containing protein [Aphanothece sp. CMT-3BRIN-NPC111]|jgi:ribosomal protein L16 Arg81 hydroxylase|nr:cupin domain-containing protein [Aphanothece sp. CMT-3BRIN-NPC111]